MSAFTDMNESRKAAMDAAKRAVDNAILDRAGVYAYAADAYARIYAADVERFNGRG